MKVRPFLKEKDASAVPIMLFAVTILVCGALYTLFFIEVAIPYFGGYVPASDSKTFIMMLIYAIPLFVAIVGVLALLQAGMKRQAGVL